MLSSYPSDVLNDYIKCFKWYSKGFEGNVSVAAKSGGQKKKIEVVTCNFEP